MLFLTVRSAEEILKKARAMDAARVTVTAPQQSQAVARRLDVLEARLDFVMKKLSINENNGLSAVQAKLMTSLAEWKSTNQLAGALGYRQEYVSRQVAQLKHAGYLEERKTGKTIFYKVVQRV
ncbi:MAG: hypothetical protein HYS81_04250 [Candidatus Aenigmatarchaeota archaeon]|nr:MAG: hypothetical protein HYS81_04250 [Candidatus Aenigmarchaeota archaeon]